MESKQKKKKVESLLSKATEVFAIFDSHQSGFISFDELGNFIRTLGFNPTEREICQIQEKLKDLKVEEEVDLEALLEVVKNFERHDDLYEDLLEAFKTLDPNETGYVLAKELKELVMNHGEPLTEEEANAMLARADADRRGKIKYIDFAQIMTKEDQ